MFKHSTWFFFFSSARSLWEKESKLSAEIDKLKAEVEKAEKSLDHATPGVSDYFPFSSLSLSCACLLPKSLASLACKIFLLGADPSNGRTQLMHITLGVFYWVVMSLERVQIEFNALMLCENYI